MDVFPGLSVFFDLLKWKQLSCSGCAPQDQIKTEHFNPRSLGRYNCGISRVAMS